MAAKKITFNITKSVTLTYDEWVNYRPDIENHEKEWDAMINATEDPDRPYIDCEYDGPMTEDEIQEMLDYNGEYYDGDDEAE